MTYHRIEPGLARLIERSLDAELEERKAVWREHLKVGRVNEEMKVVFQSLGWLTSGRDPRLGVWTEPDDGATPPTWAGTVAAPDPLPDFMADPMGEPVDIREPMRFDSASPVAEPNAEPDAEPRRRRKA